MRARSYERNVHLRSEIQLCIRARPPTAVTPLKRLVRSPPAPGYTPTFQAGSYVVSCPLAATPSPPFYHSPYKSVHAARRQSESCVRRWWTCRWTIARSPIVPARSCLPRKLFSAEQKSSVQFEIPAVYNSVLAMVFDRLDTTDFNNSYVSCFPKR